METYTIKRNGQFPLEFEGELLAEATDETHRNNIVYSIYTLYKTKSNRYVLQLWAINNWEGAPDTHAAWVADDILELVKKHERDDRVGGPYGVNKLILKCIEDAGLTDTIKVRI